MSEKSKRSGARVTRPQSARPLTNVAHSTVSFQNHQQQQHHHPHHNHHQSRATGGTGGTAALTAGRSELNFSESTFHKSGPNANVRLENTYKMSPDDGCVFLSAKVEHLMKEVLQKNLKDVKYDSKHCSKISQDLCAAIKTAAKELEFQRYKLVATVVIGQDSEQSVEVASRCLWNPATDNFATATFRNDSLYAIATVYGIYLD